MQASDCANGRKLCTSVTPPPQSADSDSGVSQSQVVVAEAADAQSQQPGGDIDIGGELLFQKFGKVHVNEPRAMRNDAIWQMCELEAALKFEGIKTGRDLAHWPGLKFSRQGVVYHGEEAAPEEEAALAAPATPEAATEAAAGSGSEAPVAEAIAVPKAEFRLPFWGNVSIEKSSTKPKGLRLLVAKGYGCEFYLTESDKYFCPAWSVPTTCDPNEATVTLVGDPAEVRLPVANKIVKVTRWSLQPLPGSRPETGMVLFRNAVEADGSHKQQQKIAKDVSAALLKKLVDVKALKPAAPRVDTSQPVTKQSATVAKHLQHILR